MISLITGVPAVAGAARHTIDTSDSSEALTDANILKIPFLTSLRPRLEVPPEQLATIVDGPNPFILTFQAPKIKPRSSERSTRYYE